MENVLADVDDEVGADAHDVRVESTMMEAAEGEAVRDDGFTPWVAIRKDVRRVEQLGVAQPADGASLLIRAEDAPPEALLVQAPACQLGDVPATSLGGQRGTVLSRFPR